MPEIDTHPLPVYTHDWDVAGLCWPTNAPPAELEDRFAPDTIFFVPSTSHLVDGPGTYVVRYPCVFCRKVRKQFCDRGFPLCSRCAKHGMSCEPTEPGYMALPRKQPQRTTKVHPPSVSSSSLPPIGPTITQARSTNSKRTTYRTAGRLSAPSLPDSYPTRALGDIDSAEIRANATTNEPLQPATNTDDIDALISGFASQTLNDEQSVWKLAARSWARKPTTTSKAMRKAQYARNDAVSVAAAGPWTPEMGFVLWSDTMDELCQAVSFIRSVVDGFQFSDGNVLEVLVLMSEAISGGAWIDDVLSVTLSASYSSDWAGPGLSPQPSSPNTPPEIEGLFLTHRLGIPFCLVVRQGFNYLPFVLNVPYAVLGWYHIIEATEGDLVVIQTPSGSELIVHWSFKLTKAEYSNAKLQELREISSRTSFIHTTATEGHLVSPLPDEPSAQSGYSHRSPDGRLTISLTSQLNMALDLQVTSENLIESEGWAMAVDTPSEGVMGEQRSNRDKIPPWLFSPAELSFPPLVPNEPHTPRQIHVIQDLFKGFICPECRKCNARTHWNKLYCSGCNKFDVPKQPNWNRKALMPNDRRFFKDDDREETDLTKGMSVKTDIWEDGVKSILYETHGDRETRVAHVWSTKSILRKDLDGIFESISRLNGLVRLTTGKDRLDLTKYYIHFMGEGKFAVHSDLEPLPFDAVDPELPELAALNTISEYMAQCASRTILSELPEPWDQQILLLGSDQSPTQMEKWDTDVTKKDSGVKLVFMVVGSECELKVTPLRIKGAERLPEEEFLARITLRHGDFIYICSPKLLKYSISRKGFGLVVVGRWSLKNVSEPVAIMA